MAPIGYMELSVYYDLVRKALFLLEPEFSHHVALEAMKCAERIHLSGMYRHSKLPSAPVETMGLTFDNPVGLAAGLDKNGDYIDALGDLGFGFIEIGTVTPRPQAGNPKPRLFRLPEHQAIINRMGFNNKGVDHLVAQVQKRTYKGILGINIGKNFDTPLEQANSDYLIGLEKVYPYADYITVNLSSPNTAGLRKLQIGEALKELVNILAIRKTKLEIQYQKSVPLLIKVAPDMNYEELLHLAQVAMDCKIDGVIATNTTISRENIINSPLAAEAGGLSGQPVFESSTKLLADLAKIVSGRMTLIGVGGVDSIGTALSKFDAGADLIQLYTGFIYRGPGLVSEIRKAVALRQNLTS
jgi:dihydroorotate dehydrogenase